jgi:hypothetical protein
VLQIIVAISPGDVAKAGEDPFFNDAALTAAGGFVVAVCMMFSFRRMVAGQLENYERTNAGLQAQAKEAADFAAMIARTQGAAGERINREMGRGGAVSPNGTPMPNRPPPTSPSPRTSPSPGSPEPPEGASTASKTSTTFAPAAAGGPTVAGGAGGGAAVPAQLVSSDGSNLSGNLMQSSERKPPTRGKGNRSSLMKKMIDDRAMDVRFEAKAQSILLDMRLYNVLNVRGDPCLAPLLTTLACLARASHTHAEAPALPLACALRTLLCLLGSLVGGRCRRSRLS